ncbi:class I SAM-dependent methyltransferase [Albibacterium profundi]|uniref:THUMP-like domain-containing protein n=1 Tax=Albibacterium profundi TaxID=3134906 RepID=A0ABV5CJH8_9SPHI
MKFNPDIITPEVQEFILRNENASPSSIALKQSPFSGVSGSELAQQIESRRKAKKKLPTWFQAKGIYYPKALSIEQSSSEITANFKQQLIKTGTSLIDLTGGFGVDTHYMSLSAKQVLHCELDPLLSEIAKHNARILKRPNIDFNQGNGIDIVLSRPKGSFDTIYVDPARRVNTKKVFLLQDCEPNILDHHSSLLERAKQVIVKSSPLLDISQTLTQLTSIQEIYILSIKNECKELLIVLQETPVQRPRITVKLLNRHEVSFSFYPDEEQRARPIFGEPETYLYDPDAALLKAGCFKLISSYYQIKKLHTNTHLYTSKELIDDFAGRVCRIKKVSDYKDFKKEKNHKPASIVSKNFPIKAEALRKKHNIEESSDHFLYFCKDVNEKLQVVSAERLT